MTRAVSVADGIWLSTMGLTSRKRRRDDRGRDPGPVAVRPVGCRQDRRRLADLFRTPAIRSPGRPRRHRSARDLLSGAARRPRTAPDQGTESQPVIGNFTTAGAQCVVVSGVLDPATGVHHQLPPAAAVLTWLTIMVFPRHRCSDLQIRLLRQSNSRTNPGLAERPGLACSGGLDGTSSPPPARLPTTFSRPRDAHRTGSRP